MLLNDDYLLNYLKFSIFNSCSFPYVVKIILILPSVIVAPPPPPPPPAPTLQWGWSHALAFWGGCQTTPTTFWVVTTALRVREWSNTLRGSSSTHQLLLILFVFSLFVYLCGSIKIVDFGWMVWIFWIARDFSLKPNPKIDQNMKYWHYKFLNFEFIIA
jgi:hypothetical protein